jgi:hypothetical protein
MLDGNILRIVSSEVVEAARDSLLIGQIYKRLQAQGPDAPGSEGLRRQRHLRRPVNRLIFSLAVARRTIHLQEHVVIIAHILPILGKCF